MKFIIKYRYLLFRRVLQICLLLLFFGGNAYGWNIFKGNFSSAMLFSTIPLSDPYAVVQIMAAGFIVATDALIGAAIVLVLYGLVFGRMFCAWVCPMNIVSDAAIFISKKLHLNHNAVLPRQTRYGILILGIILSFFLSTPAFETISPVSTLHRGIIFGMGAGWAIVGAVFLFDLALLRNGWCGHLCPLGASYAIIGKFALIKIRHDPEKCTDCGKCFEVCPERQVLDIINIKPGIISSSECTNCSRCIEVCDDHALKISITNSMIRKN
ncbi:MAG: quinol dehydrogenase ferredoxin subunit NapH [Bacteroidota bacterium]